MIYPSKKIGKSAINGRYQTSMLDIKLLEPAITCAGRISSVLNVCNKMDHMYQM